MVAKGQQTTSFTDESIDGYAIVGGPDHCAERHRALVDLGLGKYPVMWVSSTSQCELGRGTGRGKAVLQRDRGHALSFAPVSGG